jgi:hypothetical protein
VCCLVLLLGFFGPRFAFLAWWVFGDKIDMVWDSWYWPLLGLIFLPWTSICYALAWGPIHHVTGAGWLLVAIGLFLDFASYASRSAKARFGPA